MFPFLFWILYLLSVVVVGLGQPFVFGGPKKLHSFLFDWQEGVWQGQGQKGGMPVECLMWLDARQQQL